MSAGLVVAREGPVLILTIDRPAVANAVDAATSHAVDRALREAEADEGVGAVILTGRGERAFCSGMDLKEAARIGVGHGLVPGRGFCGITEGQFPKPLIAAVNGAAVAGGFEIALACDLVVASETATFGLPEVSRGLVAWAGGVQRLATQAPRALAMEIVMTGVPVSAQRLHAAGLVSRLAPPGRVLEEALALARQVLANGWTALRLAKALHDRARDLPLAAALDAGRELGATILAGEESREGVAAYAEGRVARFGGAPA